MRKKRRAHYPKGAGACILHDVGAHSRGLEDFAAGARPQVPPRPGSPPQNPPNPRECAHTLCSMHAPVHFGECACPFYRMRLSILANVPFYFYIFLCMFIFVSLYLNLLTLWEVKIVF